MSAPHRASGVLLLVLFSLLFLFSAAAAAAATGASHDGHPTTHLHFYFHEFFSGPNATTVTLSEPRSGNGVSNGSSFELGFMAAFDVKLRQDADPSSRLIGQAQGLSVGVSVSDSALLTVANLAFTDGPFNGSTLQVLGRSKLGTEVLERPILGGTGVFRMARGYTLSKIVEFVNNDRLIFEFDAYVWH